MKAPNHVGRWIAAGASVLALAGAGTAVATTEPPGDTEAATGDTSMSTGDTSVDGGSTPSTGAGPSDCPPITEGSEAAEGTDTAMATDMAEDTAMATDVAEDSAADDTSMDTSMDTTMETTGDSMAADVSTPPMDGPMLQIVETDEYGPILVDGACYTVYAFTPDVDGVPTCVDDCAATWPPVFADEVPPLADELDPSLFSVVDHPDGSVLKVGDWPLYYFAGDMAPGETNGQAVGGVWWVVAPDGTLIETEEGAEESEGTEATEDTGAAEETEAATETTEG